MADLTSEQARAKLTEAVACILKEHPDFRVGCAVFSYRRPGADAFDYSFTTAAVVRPDVEGAMEFIQMPKALRHVAEQLEAFAAKPDASQLTCVRKPP